MKGTKSSTPQTHHQITNLPLQWAVYYTDDNDPYYYNKITGETTWIHPNEINE